MTTRIRQGDSDKQKKTLPKPKDWAFLKPSEGRKGKKKLAKLKTTHAFWSKSTTAHELLRIRAGTPECKCLIACAEPRRVLTARDILYILQDAHENPHEDLEVKYSTDLKTVEFQDLTTILLSDSSTEMQTPLMNR